MGDKINQALNPNSEDWKQWKRIYATRSHDHRGVSAIIPEFSMLAYQAASDSITNVKQKIRRILLTFLDGDKDLSKVFEEFVLFEELPWAVKCGTNYKSKRNLVPGKNWRTI
eukprot:UN01029